MERMERERKRRESVKRYNKKKMACQTVKVRKEVLAEFKMICCDRGDKVNTVLREAIENYVERNRVAEPSGLATLRQSLETEKKRDGMA